MHSDSAANSAVNGQRQALAWIAQSVSAATRECRTRVRKGSTGKPRAARTDHRAAAPDPRSGTKAGKPQSELDQFVQTSFLRRTRGATAEAWSQKTPHSKATQAWGPARPCW